MSKKDKDILEELFRSKLYDHEVDTDPGDWEMIASRLPESKPAVRTLRHTRLYWSAAAAVALLMAVSVYFTTQPPSLDHQIADIIQQETELIKSTPIEEQPVVVVEQEQIEKPAVATVQKAAPVTSAPQSRQVAPVSSLVITEQVNTFVPDETPGEEVATVQAVEEAIQEKQSSPKVLEGTRPESVPLIADATPVQKTKEAKPRRWGFGMGGGNFSAGTSNTVSTLSIQSASYQVDEKLIFMNAPTMRESELKTNIKHKTPVSFGMSASYYLTNRWSIVGGLSYSMLNSQWETNAGVGDFVKQRLHFIGIPVAINYKIAEWNRLQVYASAGFMPELNVSGKRIVESLIVDGDAASKTTESMRMKRLYWSVNARGGVSCPIVRFLSAFAEVGAGYYFDNGTDIETIHSDKPFNVSFNFGFRFGF